MVAKMSALTAQVGDAEIARVEEMRQELPLAALTHDQSLLSPHPSWLAPYVDTERGSIELVVQTWLLHVGGKTIVIDPCSGNGRERPVLPSMHRLDTPFLERFEATGVRPEDVDYVFCTHLHCDHCGWNTRLSGGRWVPTFPKARYLFVRREVARWDPARPDHRPVDFNVGVYEDSVRPVIEAGLADLVPDRHAILPGLTIEPAYGHTAGHSLLHLESRGEEAYFTGDAFHHPLQVLRPGLHLEGCDDLAAAIATREYLCRTIAERAALMVPAHFAGPHCGRIVSDGDGFRFEGQG